MAADGREEAAEVEEEEAEAEEGGRRRTGAGRRRRRCSRPSAVLHATVSGSLQPPSSLLRSLRHQPLPLSFIFTFGGARVGGLPE